jgi:aminoglycoside phosphotransferase (APT) family kinase protein
MEWVDGVNPAESRPPTTDPACGSQWSDAFATLGEVDHVAVALGNFGRPKGCLKRQVGRWLSEPDSYRELDGNRTGLP